MKRFFLFSIMSLFLQLAHAQTTRYFEFTVTCGHGNWQDTSFIAATSDQAVIDSVLANIARPLEERQFIVGPIDYGNGGHNHNASHWFLWHFIPDEWNLADFAIEVCDGCPYTDVDADTAYWVGNLGQFCPWSGRPAREVSLVSGVDDPFSSADEPLFFPNPAGNSVTLNLQNSEGVSVQLFNAVGQQVAYIPNAAFQQELDIAQLRNGIYYLKFTKDKSTVTQKLVVNGE